MDVPTTESKQLESVLEVESPCTGICQTDFFDVCKGCKRTLDEISEWPFLSNREKQQIIDRIFG
jgi:predicted Fe-S protein YdhL (DUF1289 family)